MAKYTDYVKPDEIEEEIAEAKADKEVRDKVDVPDSVKDRFDGKSIEDVMNSYAELEVAFSRQGQKTGELRKSFDEYVALQSPDPEPEPEPDPVTVDDFYEDAEGTIAKVVDKRTNKRIEELEQLITARDQSDKLRDFTSGHPDWQTTAKSQEFIDWLQEKPYRAELAQKADNYDFNAADALFSMYEDLSVGKEEVAEQVKRDDQLRDASLESSTPDSPQIDTTFSRTEIIDRKIAARNGHSESQRWLATNGDAIRQAYTDGHVTD